METNLHNSYLFRAIEAYPWELEKAMEALNYALSYDPTNVRALCLMAKAQMEQFGDYELAKDYYERALASRLDIPEVYPEYIRLLINNEDFEEAQKLIDFARTVKGVDKAGIELCQANLFESMQEFEKAENALNEAKQLALNNEFICYVEEVISRVIKKRQYHNNKAREIENTQKKEVVETDKNWLRNRLNNLL